MSILSAVRQDLAARAYASRDSLLPSKLTSRILSLFVRSVGGYLDLDLRACFCFFSSGWQASRRFGASTALLAGVSCSQTRCITVCTTQAFNRSISYSLLVRATGGTCTFSAVKAAAAHHPQLDHAEIVSLEQSSKCIQPDTALENCYELTHEGHQLPLLIIPSSQQVHCLILMNPPFRRASSHQRRETSRLPTRLQHHSSSYSNHFANGG
ncbi:hypothetical protein N431DRAFT_63387 [Stipitochalara longipes BDJ]|nr:hypothetical protein N431DRAFT_63387 [Stipitochalara longipes BDJ]